MVTETTLITSISLAVMILSLMASFGALAISVMIAVRQTAKEHSTHVIEYRDPYTNYDGEQETKETERPIREDDEQDLDSLNSFIQKEGVII